MIAPKDSYTIHINFKKFQAAFSAICIASPREASLSSSALCPFTFVTIKARLLWNLSSVDKCLYDIFNLLDSIICWLLLPLFCTSEQTKNSFYRQPVEDLFYSKTRTHFSIQMTDDLMILLIGRLLLSHHKNNKICLIKRLLAFLSIPIFPIVFRLAECRIKSTLPGYCGLKSISSNNYLALFRE